MGVISMANAEERLINEINALKKERSLTFSHTLERDLSKRIRGLERDLAEYRKLRYGKVTYKDNSGISPEDLVTIKKLYFKCGCGIDEIDESFKGKYRHSQIRTAVLEMIKYGN